MYDINTFIGDHEMQVSEGGEADLHHHFHKCHKNPGHSQFIPISKFQIKHLPKDFQDQNIYELIKALADLTVRIDVKMISPSRPEFWPGTSIPYPFYGISGSNMMRTGSGKITVLKYSDGHVFDADGKNGSLYGQTYRPQTCPCDNCRNFKSPNKTWYEIIVWTAAHVVFDSIEAKRTSCRLFFDSGHAKGIVVLSKLDFRYGRIEDDRCSLVYATCDKKLGERLYKKAKYCRELWKKIDNKYMRSSQKLVFIVSHPHGCPKHVSLGHLLGVYTLGDVNESLVTTKLTYTTSTCPGSSGARVHCVGFLRHVHSGTLNTGHNYSSTGVWCK